MEMSKVIFIFLAGIVSGGGIVMAVGSRYTTRAKDLSDIFKEPKSPLKHNIELILRDTPIFETRETAIEVLTLMKETIKDDGVVTIAEYCNLAGISATMQHCLYGWDNLDEAYILCGESKSEMKHFVIVMPSVLNLQTKEVHA